MSEPIGIRPYRESDKPFVYDNWLESFRVSHAAGPFPMRLYRKVYTEAINDLLGRSSMHVLIACDPNDDDQLFGFLCFERRAPPVVHYLYVKQLYRREWRIATLLMTAAEIPTGRTFMYTFKSPMAAKIVEHWTGATFDPLIARFPPKHVPEDR